MSDNMAAPDSTGACCPSPLAVSEELPPKSSEPSSTPNHQPHPNQVRTVMLTGVPIVSLVIDAKERLCLAQISNTLLKSFSYNEIHNRRVALGITCVQCTPVQLEILRRAGAMPISSRRCGMITKREAERLCRSFLADSSPPKLPDNFSFDVTHECAWGSRGNFLPSRYNSSRAKCIKCFYCNMFFSPNKFIFHSHRLSESKYVQPDAANFNSWRRHLKLTGSPPIDVRYAWEDVKAMFNGGSRKRITSSHRFSSSSSGSLHGSKRIRQMESANEHHQEVSRSVDTQNPQPSSTSPYNVPTNFPCYPAGKVFANNPYAPRPTLPPLPSTFVDWRSAGGAKPPHFNPNPYNFLHWPRQPQPPPPPMPPSGDMMHSPIHEENQAHDYDDHRAYNDMDSNSESSRYDSEQETRRRSVSSCSEVDFRSSDNEESRGNNSSGVVVNLRPRFDSPTFLPASAVVAAAGVDKPMYCSAFRPVIQRSSVHSVESLIRPSSSTAILRDVKLSGDSNSKLSLSPSGCKENGSVHSESIDVELTDEATTPNPPSPWINKQQTTTNAKISELEINQVKEDNEVVSVRRHPPLPLPPQPQPPPTSSSSSSSSTTVCAGPPSPSTSHTLMVVNREMDSTQLAIMTKDELEQLLMGEAAARKRAEKKCELIKESLEEQVKREVAYREDMAKQLEIVKETLCNELDQERKARFAILQKLKEAHDALHHFSCKVLIPRHCTDCTYKPMLPQ